MATDAEDEDNELTEELELDHIADLFREQLGAALKHLTGDDLDKKCRLLASNFIFDNQWLLSGMEGTNALYATNSAN